MENRDVQLATNETILELIRHQKENNKLIKNMFFGLVAITITMMLCTTVLYVLNNYQIEGSTTTTTEQSAEGNASIINGGQFNDSAVQNNN